jgi:glucosamine--fructose-6-phosphate aminotransferase (isomerizing)
MCGIVGYIGPRNASAVVMHGLQRLEYRGYDSAGVATYDAERGLQTQRSVGKLHTLFARLEAEPLSGTLGLGHTRWATHGGVTEANAHPHSDQTGDIVVVQNGIVENYRELKARLIDEGYTFCSQTDTEVIAHLISSYYRTGRSLEQAMRLALSELRGGNAVVAFCRHEPDRLVAARLGNAGGVVIGLGQSETLIASDLPALLDYTHRVIFLENRDLAVITREQVQISRLDGMTVARQPTTIAWDPESAAKGSYDHFMQKEIYEQPRALMDVLRGRVDLEAAVLRLDDITLSDAELRRIQRIYAVACGTAWHAGLVAKFIIESLARVRVEVDYASEFRYRQPVLGDDALLLAISQSGETVDTLAAMEEARMQGVHSAAIVNAPESQAARLADAGVIYLHAGPEIGVASTKCFTSMLVASYLFALRLAQARNVLTPLQIQEHLHALAALPDKATHVLETTRAQCAMLAERYSHVNNALYLGRQISYPIALEGALKMKEISYIHAEGYPAGEMKHGPIALIDDNLPVFCIAPRDAVYEKMLSNIEQVQARRGHVVAVTTEGTTLATVLPDHTLYIPETLPLLTPVLSAIPLQLLAYYTALRRGCDVDQPRNLAKSVTVE